MYAYLKIQHCPERGDKVETVIVDIPEETALQAQHLLGAKIGLSSAAEIIQVELSCNLVSGDNYRRYSGVLHFCLAAERITWKKD